MRLARELQHLLQGFIIFGVERQGDVHVRCAERMLPVVWRIGTEVMQDRGARRHALPEFDRETVEGCLRHAQRLEPLEGEGDPQPAGQGWHPPFVGGCDVRKDPPQHLPSLARVAYAENDVFATVRFRTRAQDDRLYVARFDRCLDVACFGYMVLRSTVRNHAIALPRVVLTTCPCVAQVVAFGLPLTVAYRSATCSAPHGIAEQGAFR